MSVTDSEFGDAICQLVKDLCMQAEALLGKDDDRLEATTELLTQTIWRTVCEFVNVDLKEIRIDEEKLQYMFSTIQGRVLTLWKVSCHLISNVMPSNRLPLSVSGTDMSL